MSDRPAGDQAAKDARREQPEKRRVEEKRHQAERDEAAKYRRNIKGPGSENTGRESSPLNAETPTEPERDTLSGEREARLSNLDQYNRDRILEPRPRNVIRFRHDMAKPVGGDIEQWLQTHEGKMALNFPETRITIHTYTDRTGPEAYNMRLSEDRGKNIKNQLIESGIDPKQIEVVAHGESAAREATHSLMRLEEPSDSDPEDNTFDPAFRIAVLKIRRQDIDVVPDFDDWDILEADPSVRESGEKTSMSHLLDRAREVAEDIRGERGNRIRRILQMASEVGYPRNWDLWYYDPTKVEEYADMSTDEERRKMLSATQGRLPADGRGWRRYPFQEISKEMTETDMTDTTLRVRLREMDRYIFESLDVYPKVKARYAGDVFSEMFWEMESHLRDLQRDSSHLYSIYR